MHEQISPQTGWWGGGVSVEKKSYKDYKKKIKEVNAHQEHETKLQIVLFC